jgi:hypothetical protein
MNSGALEAFVGLGTRVDPALVRVVPRDFNEAVVMLGPASEMRSEPVEFRPQGNLSVLRDNNSLSI